MTRITITLEPEEGTALQAVARREKRDPRKQAAVLIRLELERRGLLQADGSQPARKATERPQ